MQNGPGNDFQPRRSGNSPRGAAWKGNGFRGGDEFRPNGKYMANTCQGLFPVTNTAENGFVGKSPVTCRVNVYFAPGYVDTRLVG